MPVIAPDGRSLVGPTVRLDPLSLDDAEGLLPCFADPRVYTQGFVMHAPPVDLDGMRALISARLRPGKVPYTVRVDGVVVGTSSLMDVDLVNERTHIGSTLYHPDQWGTQVNPETKLLLLGHAFESLGAGRVQLKTDVRNHRSQQAIARLGAHYEGTLRRYQRRADGTVRDTAMFALLAEDWPAARAGLQQRLDAAAGG